jgi:hypothetical protein
MNDLTLFWFIGGIFVGWLTTCVVLSLDIDTKYITRYLRALIIRLGQLGYHLT